jgi:hypothetical protein
VLDANVVVAAFAVRGLCEPVFELCLDSHEILLSEPLPDLSRRGNSGLSCTKSNEDEGEIANRPSCLALAFSSFIPHTSSP